MKSTVRYYLALILFCGAFTGCDKIKGLIEESRKEEIVFVWLDASGSFVYDPVKKVKKEYRDMMIRDIKNGLKDISQKKILGKYYLIIGLITDRIDSERDFIVMGKLSGGDLKNYTEFSKIFDERINLLGDKRYGHTDIFGSFVLMENMLERIDPNMEKSAYYAIYYSDMQHTQNWKTDERKRPNPKDFKYLKKVKMTAVFAVPENKLFKITERWLNSVGIKLKIEPPQKLQSGESVFFECIN